MLRAIATASIASLWIALPVDGARAGDPDVGAASSGRVEQVRLGRPKFSSGVKTAGVNVGGYDAPVVAAQPSEYH